MTLTWIVVGGAVVFLACFLAVSLCWWDYNSGHKAAMEDAKADASHLRKKYFDQVVSLTEQHDRDLADLRQRIVEYLAKRTKLDEESGLPLSYAMLRAQMDVNSVPLRAEREKIETGETA